ncbi:uncharacterized protein LOC130950457 [Arachis stenosperma]|uniref:uncharacterized protein LOC130950457 n=1 Tax=Arachis stenosperma TaxID=217475 RepID=UPI0025ACBF62|nr:uncharacterized protein LOC130950457 [Arachis stenosperma]
MSHRLLPDSLRQQIRQYEQYKWQEIRGVDEDNLICNLPKDLRRDIKRHLCLALLMRVPPYMPPGLLPMHLDCCAITTQGRQGCRREYRPCCFRSLRNLILLMKSRLPVLSAMFITFYVETKLMFHIEEARKRSH